MVGTSFEYRLVLPFSLDEFQRGLKYLFVRQRKEIGENSANGEQVEKLSESPFAAVPEIVVTHGRVPGRHVLGARGTYTHNKIFLGTRFPGWMRSLLPDSALTIHEHYYLAPVMTMVADDGGASGVAASSSGAKQQPTRQRCMYTFCRYTSELFPSQLDFTIESLHVENDTGDRGDVFAEMSGEERRLATIQHIDFTVPVADVAGVFQGDPTAAAVAPRTRGVPPRGPLPAGSTRGG